VVGVDSGHWLGVCDRFADLPDWGDWGDWGDLLGGQWIVEPDGGGRWGWWPVAAPVAIGGSGPVARRGCVGRFASGRADLNRTSLSLSLNVGHVGWSGVQTMPT
jgi:hypothetical protein